MYLQQPEHVIVRWKSDQPNLKLLFFGMGEKDISIFVNLSFIKKGGKIIIKGH